MGDLSDELRELTVDPIGGLSATDPTMRRLAVSAAVPRLGDSAIVNAVIALLGDDDERVRAEAAEALGHVPAPSRQRAVAALLLVHEDESPIVIEAVATAYGELEESTAVPWLRQMATGDGDSLVREAAVAALGAIGDDTAVPDLIALAGSGPPQVRRRSIVALSVFDGAEVEEAVRAGLEDRNPMVREAAEMVVGETMRVRLRDHDAD